MRCFIVLLGVAALLSNSVCAATPVRYRDNVFTNVTVTSNITYGSNVKANGARQTLLLDVYQPTGDTAKARPLVIFMFGGGWAVGKKTDGDMVLLSRTFAQKGYVAVSIDYRLDSALLSTKPWEPMVTSMYRGMQDAKAAVRFLRVHKSDYKIDDTRIFMGGCSAGAFNSLMVAFLDPQEIPSFIDTNKVGGIEGNSGTPGVSSAINGVISNWGAVEDSTWLYNNKIPVICFAGTADPQVPFDHSGSLFGSACINRVLLRKGVYSVLKPFIGMGHGMGTSDPRYDTLLTMASKFTYDVLFGDKGTSVLRSEKSVGPVSQQSSLKQAAVYNTVNDDKSSSLGCGSIYTVNGKIAQRKDPSHNARGVYIFQNSVR